MVLRCGHLITGHTQVAGYTTIAKVDALSDKLPPPEYFMNTLNLPLPSWMTEDLVLLEEQARRFIAAEYRPQDRGLERARHV